MESTPREPGSEEYRDSEKYQLRHWTLQQPDSLWSLIARMNRIRRENTALQSDSGLHFCNIDNDQLIAYLKIDAAGTNVILTVVNLDPHHPQSGWVDLDVGGPEVRSRSALPGARFAERSALYMARPVQLRFAGPAARAGACFRLRRRVRSERDFDYYL